MRMMKVVHKRRVCQMQMLDAQREGARGGLNGEQDSGRDR